MKEKESALFSRYIIDGIQCDASPYELLTECMEHDFEIPGYDQEYADIIDETTDLPVTSLRYSPEDYRTDLELTAGKNVRTFRMLYPETFTRQRIAEALIDRIWDKGHFRLGDLSVCAEWEWNTRPLGNMAAFYHSVQAASEYIYDLGSRLKDYFFKEGDVSSYVRFTASLRESLDEDSGNQSEAEPLFKASPYESRHPWIEEERLCPETMSCDENTYIIYIPFDTSPFGLGGSLMAEVHGHNGGIPPHIQDPDYFIDCYEVVRELVEDGVITAGITICDGGLAKAAESFCAGAGLEISLNGISSSYMEDDTTKILFSEIPGVLVQINDSEMDYFDSQLLLQDIAYYRIGSPTASFSGIRINREKNAAVAGILASLINQASEGED